MTLMTKTDAAIPTPTPVTCGNCGADERRLLHHVRHRGNFRRLCTSCVLRLHPQSFCPTCFLVYDRAPSSSETVTCFKCYSSSHSPCAGVNATNPYICPACANPQAIMFAPKKTNDSEKEGGDVNWRALDNKSAKVLLAAARIAAMSMSKAAVGARAEAERRVKEAAFTRKRAREALEHVAFLVAKEKQKRKDLSVEVSGSGNNATPRERNSAYHRAINANNFGVANVAASTLQNRIVDGANEVSARLNAVGLREKERVQGFGGQSSGSGLQNNGGTMAVEGHEKARVNSGASVGVPCVQNNGNQGSGNIGHLESNGAQGEKANGLHPVTSAGDEALHKQNNHGSEGTVGSQQ